MDEERTGRGGPLYWLGRRSRRFWIAVVAMTPLLYLASFGPACWWFAEEVEDGDGQIYFRPSDLYFPIGLVYRHSARNGQIRHAIEWYATIRHQLILIPINMTGTAVYVPAQD